MTGRVTVVLLLFASCGREAATPPPEPVKPVTQTVRPVAVTPAPQPHTAAVLSDDARTAVQLLEDYYRAIDAREYNRAFAMWGASGPPNQTLQSFTEGFADTESVRADVGTPSRVEGAAGSRYIEVPIAITAKARDGKTRRFSGTYVLRRVVVDGAPAADARWHIDHASLR
jgi:hypothetical protein